MKTCQGLQQRTTMEIPKAVIFTMGKDDCYFHQDSFRCLTGNFSRVKNKNFSPWDASSTPLRRDASTKM